MRRLTRTDAYETDARFSPRSHFVSFVRDQNLYVIELATGKERAVTREGGGLVSFGMAEFIAQEEMDRDTGYWWSPDERHIALARVDESPVTEVERFEIQATGATRRAPALSRHRHGATRAWICSSPISRPRAACSSISAPMPTSIYRASTGSPTAAASPCSARAATRRRSSCCASTRSPGAGRVLLTERSDTWVPLHRELTFLQTLAAVHLGVVARRLPASLSLRQRRQADPPAHLGRIHGGGRIARVRDPRRRRARAPRVFHRESALADRTAALLGVARCAAARRNA